MSVQRPGSPPAPGINGILPGGCVLRPMNDVSGKEFKTPAELEDFVKKNKGQLSLAPGASFLVYLPRSVNPNDTIYGARSTQFEGLNQRTPLKIEKVSGKPAPIRTPGDWVRVSANPQAKPFSKDRISLMTRESIMCQPPTSSKHFDVTLTVVP
jgi:hypothetical protein